MSTADAVGTTGAAGGTGSLRERKKLRTWSALQHAALELASEHGVQETSIDDICQRAGVSSRTFFNYFPSKISAIVGLDGRSVLSSLRDAYLSRARQSDSLVYDTCHLVADVAEQRSLDQNDRELRRGLVLETPELLQVGLAGLVERSGEIVSLVSERAGADLNEAQVLTTLVIAALSCVVRNPTAATGLESLGDATYAMVLRMQSIGQ
ncbi:TetR/AcrR family transcriptional regulator [soil metagenome]